MHFSYWRLLRQSLKFLIGLICLLGVVITVSRNVNTHKRKYTGCEMPKTNVFFLRVPKTGTSTTTFTFWRFAIRHNINVLLPKRFNEDTYLGISEKYYDLPLGTKHEGIVANQLVYNPNNFSQHLSPNMKYIALLRHPLNHFSSVIYYSGHPYLQLLPEGNLLLEYLRDPEGYEKKWNYEVSLTNNPYAFYFGLDKNKLHDDESVKELISKIDKEFEAVLILEHFDESLIMMRRILCWSFQDILYKKENINKAKPKLSSENEIRSKHMAWATADYNIYYHFMDKLQKYTSNGGEDFANEVLEFKSVIHQVGTFCDDPELGHESSVQISDGVYYDAFVYTMKNCTLLSSSSVVLRNIIREKQGSPLE